ncbi:MAG: DMT family transporter [Actinomycetota bacterium]|nr:DMT family transporter [Actinomycetota bacterium]
MTESPRGRLLAAASLVGVTAIWGSTFMIVKKAIGQMPPFEFLTIRFALATAVIAPFAAKKMRSVKLANGLRGGMYAGGFLAIGYATQTIGLRYTTATRSAFITGLTVIFAPIMATVFAKKPPSRVAAAGVVIATVGLALLTGGPTGRFGLGEMLTVATSLAFGAHVVALSRFSPKSDPWVLTLVQVLFCALAFSPVALLTEDLVRPSSAFMVEALALTGIGATAIGFFVMVWAQKRLSPTATAVTLTMEPVFAGLTSYLVTGETLSGFEQIGAVLIIAAMLLADLRGDHS